MEGKILLVDDEKEFTDALAERMKSRGMDVSATTSPKDALKKVETESYDAVILDLAMPEMDGIATFVAMKEKNPDLQVIFLTGRGTIEKGIEAIKLGASDFLEKPIDIKVLTEKIKKAKAQKILLVEKSSEKKIKKIISEKGW